MTADRLAEIEEQWARYPYLHDAADQGWLIAEVKRLRIRDDVAKAVIEVADKEIRRLRGIERAARAAVHTQKVNGRCSANPT